MVEEIKVEKQRPLEYLKKWSEEAGYEVLPTEKAWSLIGQIPQKNEVRVTCRPTGMEETLRFIEGLDAERRKETVPHMAARRIRDEKHFDEITERLLRAETKKIFVVGGDGEPAGENYQKAEDVLSGFYRRGVSFEKIGIGGYPEGNPVLDMDPTEILLRKQDIAELMQTEMEIVTQMCFDPEVLVNWVKEIRKKGVYLPVTAGVPGRLKPESLMKALSALGVGDVVAFIKSKPKLAKALMNGAWNGFSPEDWLKELAERNEPGLGIKGVSVFTMGNISSSVKCLAGLTGERK